MTTGFRADEDVDEIHEYKEGRRCLSCGAVLSKYNPNKECQSHFHTQKQRAREALGIAVGEYGKQPNDLIDDLHPWSIGTKLQT
jgi:hypothetical protein